jgi:hypothetical protein
VEDTERRRISERSQSVGKTPVRKSRRASSAGGFGDT